MANPYVMIHVRGGAKNISTFCILGPQKSHFLVKSCFVYLFFLTQYPDVVPTCSVDLPVPFELQWSSKVSCFSFILLCF